VKVDVRDNNVDQALRVLKKKMQREGIYREMKERRNFEKPSSYRKRKKAEAPDFDGNWSLQVRVS
jgi:small subunit ribosomal protein S21